MAISKAKKTIKNYILPSVSAVAHLKRNKSLQPLRSSSTPRFICDLILEEVPLTLVDVSYKALNELQNYLKCNNHFQWQYNQIITCIKGLENISKLRAYRRYKPSLSIKQDPRAWWYYGISCLYPWGQPAICRARPTWESCLKRARQNVK